MYASSRCSSTLLPLVGKKLLIIYRAPCKQCGPKNFYIKTLRGLNAIWTSGALFPGVAWLGHEASQSHHSSTELTFKSLTCIRGVHRDDSFRSELAWNSWMRSEYFWDFLLRRAWTRACQKRCCLMFLLWWKCLLWSPCWKCCSNGCHYDVFHSIWARVKQFYSLLQTLKLCAYSVVWLLRLLFLQTS